MPNAALQASKSKPAATVRRSLCVNLNIWSPVVYFFITASPIASDALATSHVIRFSPSVVAFSFSIFANIAGKPALAPTYASA